MGDVLKRNAQIILAIMMTLMVICLAQISKADSYEMFVTWTAPGDDTTATGEWIGTCENYDMRYALNDSMPLINDYWNCARILDVPAPLEVGTSQEHSFQIEVSPGDILYIAIKSEDEANQWSGISNILQKIFDDDTNPERIDDFRITVTVRVEIIR